VPQPATDEAGFADKPFNPHAYRLIGGPMAELTRCSTGRLLICPGYARAGCAERPRLLKALPAILQKASMFTDQHLNRVALQRLTSRHGMQV
jgi:hypothetical protein